MKIRSILTIATIALVTSSCDNADKEKESLVDISPVVLEAEHNGEVVHYTIDVDEHDSASFTVTVESLDSGRASVYFDNGSNEKTFTPGSAEEIPVYVKCVDDKNEGVDAVSILFTIESSLAEVGTDSVMRQVLCPGTESKTDPDDPDDPDDPIPGHSYVRIAPMTGLFTTEDGGTATFTIVLEREPKSDVIISLSSDNTSEGAVAPRSVTFTAKNWNVPQTVTITGQDDVDIDGNVVYHIIAGPTRSTDPAYDNIAIPPITVVNHDNDSEEEDLIIVEPTTGLFTTEDGGTAKFTVVLGQKPTANVVIPAVSDDKSEGTIAPSSITFTADNWDTPQTFTVTGQDDDLFDGDMPYNIQLGPTQSDDPAYKNVSIPSITIINHNDDYPSEDLVRLISTANLYTDEYGKTATFSVVLGRKPTSNVTISAKSSDPSEGSVKPGSLTFTPSNWNVPQSITVTGLDDDEHDGDVPYDIALGPMKSDDSAYDDVAIPPVTIVNRDNEYSASELIIASGVANLVTTEAGGTATFKLSLGRKPFSDVTVALATDDTSEGIVEPNSVTFTPSNWEDTQTITITGQDDTLRDGNVEYHIKIGSSQSDDRLFDDLVLSPITVVNKDDDSLPEQVFDIEPTTGLITTEDGKTATFAVVLKRQPTSDVTIPAVSDDTSEGVVKPSFVRFTSENWDTPQLFTVTGQPDKLNDGDVKYHIEVGPTQSTDPAFDGITLSSIEVVNKDVFDSGGGQGETVKIRAMAANITTGKQQSYDPGHGIRIFKAVKPDVVMIQEFRYGNNTASDIDTMVKDAFGPEYSYVRGQYDNVKRIPNGIISRYPIIDSGSWESNVVPDRDWDWALVDLPGSKELLVVSLHLHTKNNSQEIPPLTRAIETKIAEDKANGLTYYVMIGGDFNSGSVLTSNTDLRRVVYTSFGSESTRPQDQNGNTRTNESRRKLLDVLLVDRELQEKEVPVKIGRHSYPHGHVFDSRVYAERGELGDVPPVQANDCDGSFQNQHMAVIREFQFVAE